MRSPEIVAVVLIGLVANAAIFGGLSAPADRYPGRMVWIVPVLAALFWLERQRRAVEDRRKRPSIPRASAITSGAVKKPPSRSKS